VVSISDKVIGIPFTVAENYSLKEIEEEKDEYFLDFSEKKDVLVSGKKNTETREEVPSKKKIRDKVRIKKDSSTQAKEVSIDLDFNQSWPTILNRIKKTKMAVYSFIIANNLITIENDNKLIIGFNKEYTFHKESLEKKNNKMLLQELIKKETGKFLSIECIINDNGKEDSVLEVEQENKKTAARTRNEEGKERAGRAGEMKGNAKRNSKIPEDNILIKESLNLFEGTISEEK